MVGGRVFFFFFCQGFVDGMHCQEFFGGWFN